MLTNCIGAAAHAGHENVRQPAEAVETLPARLSSNDGLKVPHLRSNWLDHLLAQNAPHRLLPEAWGRQCACRCTVEALQGGAGSI